MFSSTPPNPPSPLSNNPHFNTIILYQNTCKDITISPPDIPTPHLGISSIRISSPSAQWSALFIFCIYVPSSNCPIEYTQSLFEAVEKHVEYAISVGGVPLLGLDSNCPFKFVGDTPPGRNFTFIDSLLKKFSMVILNWDPKTVGFFTRVRGTAMSQLDIYIGPPSLLPLILSINVRTDIHFESDHVAVELILKSSPSPSPRTVPKKTTIYDWTAKAELAYQTALSKDLAGWETLLQTPPNVLRGSDAAIALVENRVSRLSSLIVKNCNINVPSKEIRIGAQQSSPLVDDPDIAQNIRLRNKARDDLQMSTVTLSSLVALQDPAPFLNRVALCKEELVGSSTRLQASFYKARESKARVLWSKLSNLYQEDRSCFSKTFKSSVAQPRAPLPVSLVINERDIRSVDTVQNCWSTRFCQPPLPEPTGINADFQHRVRQKVLSYVSIGDYDEGGPSYMHALNGPILESEVKAARTKSKGGKAPSDDGITNEMLKNGGGRLLYILTLLMNLLWTLEVIPLSWKIVILSPVYKRGSPFCPKNYRPISLLSNLFKLFERVLDARIRAVVRLIEEQCGFRPLFGSDTQLLRVSILLQYCKSHGIGVWLAFIDLEEAFEKAWRHGILYQLWVAGVRGKCWRMVRHILSKIVAFVRTNFGDTAKFRVEEGVLQGSVLAAILFIIFINPLVEALRPFCPFFNGIRFSPQLFADDLLLLANSPLKRKELMTLALAWAERWRSSVKDSKSALLSSVDAGSQPTIIANKVFKEVRALIHLGMGLDSEGVFTVAHIQSKIKKLVDRLHLLTNSGVKLGGIRPDACVALFEQTALSIPSYAYSLCPPQSHRTFLLDQAQTQFANQFLGLPEDCPGNISRSTLGLLDFSLRIARARLLLLHRVVNNDQDNLTVQMIHWPVTFNGKSFWDQSEEILLSLGDTFPLPDLLATSYAHASYVLKLAIKSRQQFLWLERSLLGSPSEASHAKALHTWGFDTALFQSGPLDIANFVSLRAGVVPIPSALTLAGWEVCGLCHRSPPSLSHILWQCEALLQERRVFFSWLPQRIHSLILKLAPDKAERIVLGGRGLISVGEWDSISECTITFISLVVEKLQNHHR